MLFAILLSVLVAAAALMAFVVYDITRVNFAGGLRVINPNGSKTALLVYQPGMSSFPTDIAYGFAKGLAENGWRVEITTASNQAPTNVSKYSLLVLVFPIYGDAPGKAIVHYIERTENLLGVETFLLSGSAGKNPLTGQTWSPQDSIKRMTQLVDSANGTVEGTLSLFTVAANKEGESAVDIATRTGSQYSA